MAIKIIALTSVGGCDESMKKVWEGMQRRAALISSSSFPPPPSSSVPLLYLVVVAYMYYFLNWCFKSGEGLQFIFPSRCTSSGYAFPKFII